MAQSSAASTSHQWARLGSVPEESTDSRRFLQSRLALFYGVALGISAAFFVVDSILAGRGLDRTAGGAFWPTGRTLHLLAIVMTLVLWLLTRRSRPLALPTLEWVDALATLALGGSYIAIGWEMGPAQPVGLLACTHIVVTRSIVVPSTARRTFWIALATLAAVPWEGWLAAAVHPLGKELYGEGEGAPLLAFIDRFLWCIAAIVVATFASRVVYGLQQRVREARQLGQYTLAEEIGRGGMGQVYRASHAMLRRPTAIKLLDPAKVNAVAVRRFEREVQLTSILTHPNTISVYDYGHTPDGIFYYAMELLDGCNLEELVNQVGPLCEARVIHILRQICGALQEAHNVGLIHRDVKPANIFLCHRGGVQDVVKVLDFGLVKDVARGSDATVTHANAITGTPMYMAPEVILAPETVGPRSDLYALGAVAYFLLTGTPVFDAENIIEVCSLHVHSAPQRPSKRLQRHLAGDLESLVLQCLSKEPEDRPASARDLAIRLEACADATSWSDTDAERWWSAHAELASGRSQASTESHVSGTGRTIEVDTLQRLRRAQSAN